jgi:S-adenosyl methyltransferase
VERPSWATEDVDLDRPSAARVYDFFLGGSHNFAADREMARQLQALLPDIGDVMRANRAFLRRVVRFLIGEGIRQFLDIGSGIPTVGNVHEVAQRAHPDARVLYVDIDPVAVAHSRAMLDGNETTGVVRADLCDSAGVLGSPEVRRLIDFSQPVGLLMVGVLHFVSDGENPHGAVSTYRDAIAPGSHLVITHVARESRPELEQIREMYQRTVAQGTLRSRPEILEFFGDFPLVEPGLVYLPQWRPDAPDEVGENAERFVAYAGVGRKP